MIAVDEALRRVLALAGPPRPETVPLDQAAGRVLLEPAVSRMTQPPFDAAAMDGWAMRAADLPGPLTIVGESAAGHPFDGEVPPGSAIRIFTGAPVPAPLDAVVMQEDAQASGDSLSVTPEAGHGHIRPRGNDFSVGDGLAEGRLLTASDIGLLAAMNVAQLVVAARPRVAIMASGDELVRPGEEPGAGQIICSNDLAIAALARQAGAEVQLLPIARDTEESLRDCLAMAAGADLLVTIGGASVGDHDLVGKVASEMGLDRAFYKIAMRPGKPLMAGKMAGSVMLGLPGNPVSSMVCSMIFMQPLIAAMQGLPPQDRTDRARLDRDLPPEGPRQHYLRARLRRGDDLPIITPFTDQDSARLAVLAQSDALLIRPPGDPARSAGEIVDYLPIG